MKMRRRFAVVILVLTLVVTLAVAGCNTVKGAGKDLESAGKAMQGD